MFPARVWSGAGNAAVFAEGSSKFCPLVGFPLGAAEPGRLVTALLSRGEGVCVWAYALGYAEFDRRSGEAVTAIEG